MRSFQVIFVMKIINDDIYDDDALQGFAFKRLEAVPSECKQIALSLRASALMLCSAVLHWMQCTECSGLLWRFLSLDIFLHTALLVIVSMLHQDEGDTGKEISQEG